MAVTLVQSTSSNPAVDPATLAFTSNVAAGTVLFCHVVTTQSGPAITISGITDTLGNTWAVVAAANVPLTVSTYRVELWKAVSLSAGANTVTVDFSGTPLNTGAMAIYEFAGMNTPVDGSSNTFEAPSEDPVRGATLTTTGAGVIFCGIRIQTAYSYVAWGDSFVDAGNGTRARLGYRITTTGVSAAPTIDMAAAEIGTSMTVVVYAGVPVSNTGIYLVQRSRDVLVRYSELYDATTSLLGFGVAPHLDLGAQTCLAYVYQAGAHEGNLGYIWSKFATTGFRVVVTTASDAIFVGFHSTGASGSPQRQSGAATFGGTGKWAHIGATWTGSLTATEILIYQALNGALLAEVPSYTGTTNGVTATSFGDGTLFTIGNSANINRTWNGSIAYVARWNRVLPLVELRRAQQYGPLSVPAGLMLCWANGRDYASNLIATTRTNVLAIGQAPMNPYLGKAQPELLLFSHSKIVFDAASNSGYKTASASYSWSHTCGGNQRFLRVAVAMLSVGGSSVTGITYNGVALSLIGVQTSVSGVVRVEQWGLVAPATGTNTIAVTLSAALDSVAGADSFTTVHQTSPTEAFAGATAVNVGAADATVDVTTVADNDWVLDAVATDDASITVGAGQTSRWNVTGALGSGAGSTEGPKTPAGSVTSSWTGVGALATWSIAAFALRPVSAASIGGGHIFVLAGGGGGLTSPGRGLAAAPCR